MAIKSRKIVTQILGVAALASGLAGTASAGSCISCVSYDGPSSKVFIYINNKASSSFLAVISRAKNTSDILDENDSYKELDRNSLGPGESYMIKDETAANSNKVYAVHMMSTYNMFRIQNDAGFTSGTTRYQGKEENMDYKTYNQIDSNPYKISCDRDFTSAGKWKITFNITDR